MNSEKFIYEFLKMCFPADRGMGRGSRGRPGQGWWWVIQLPHSPLSNP